MNIYKVETLYTEYNCSDVYDNIICEKYFVDKENAKKFLAEQIEKYDAFNKEHMSSDGLGSSYVTMMQIIDIVD